MSRIAGSKAWPRFSFSIGIALRGNDKSAKLWQYYMSNDGTAKVKAEYELTYAGKERKASILTNTLEAPLQQVRVFNEDNPWEDGWQNMLIFGDNLLALKSLYEDVRIGGPDKFGLRNKIKLIYIDPPFATRQDFMKDKEKAYTDKVAGSQFIEFVRRRLVFLREVLADDGVIYVHLDYKKSHYIKAILDEVFREENFQNEIVWEKTNAHNMPTKTFARAQDSIFFYSKSDSFYFDKPRQGFGAAQLKRYKRDTDGRLYTGRDLTFSGENPNRMDEWRGSKPSPGRSWGSSLEDREKWWKAGLILKKKDGTPRLDGLKTYLEDLNGKPINTIWNDIGRVGNTSAERTNYPTQKPEQLLERIILASSREGDVVLDGFAGSGTTLAVAEKLKRKWVGMDCGKLAVYTIQRRLLELSDLIGGGQSDDRSAFDRIENKKEVLQSRGSFLVSEKARKGDLNVTDDFLSRLHDFLTELGGIDSFSLICPEKKFFINEFTEDENGTKVVIRDHITYSFSFIKEKEPTPKAEPLAATSFVLFNAGVYDKEDILKLHWEQYREFVMKLFEVRKAPHQIKGLNLDGYIGSYSAFVWNYPEKKNVAIDEDYVQGLHDYLGGKAGDRLYVIAPSQAINFMQDEIRHGETIYTFLKVPVSVLVRLIEKGELASFKQPKSEDNVNDVIDAFGFDFISQPQLEYSLRKETKKEGLFSSDKFVISLTEFYSDGLLYSPDDFENFETLSMVLVDYNYEGEPFKMDHYAWGTDLVKNGEQKVELILDSENWIDGKLAVIFVDDYGNEKKLVFEKKDFD